MVPFNYHDHTVGCRARLGGASMGGLISNGLNYPIQGWPSRLVEGNIQKGELFVFVDIFWQGKPSKSMFFSFFFLTIYIYIYICFRVCFFRMLYLFDTHLWCQADLPQNNFYALSKEVLVRCYFASEFLEGVLSEIRTWHYLCIEIRTVTMHGFASFSSSSITSKKPEKKEGGTPWGSEFSLKNMIKHCKYQCFMHLEGLKP